MEERRKRIRWFVTLVGLATALAFSPSLWALVVGEEPFPDRRVERQPERAA